MTMNVWRTAAMVCLAGSMLTAVSWPQVRAADAGAEPVERGSEADRAAIRAHIDRIFKAYIAKNRDEVRATHDREWRGFLTGSGSIIRGLDEYMRAADGTLRSTASTMTGYDMQQLDVQFRGRDVAIVPYVAEVTGRAQGVDRRYKLRVLDVYQRQGEEWMQVASNTGLHPESVTEQWSDVRPLTPEERSELLKAREAVWRAWFAGNEAELRRVLPPETIALSAADGWTARDAIIKASLEFAKAGGRLTALDFPRTEIQAYGVVAILYTSYVFQTTTDGRGATERGKAVEVFIRRPAGWVNSGWHLAPERQEKPSA